jgi:hypothetical protein
MVVPIRLAKSTWRGELTGTWAAVRLSVVVMGMGGALHGRTQESSRIS